MRAVCLLHSRLLFRHNKPSNAKDLNHITLEHEAVLTFFRTPSLVPKNATVCRSVVAIETDVMEVLGKWMAA